MGKVRNEIQFRGIKVLGVFRLHFFFLQTYFPVGSAAQEPDGEGHRRDGDKYIYEERPPPEHQSDLDSDVQLPFGKDLLGGHILEDHLDRVVTGGHIEEFQFFFWKLLPLVLKAGAAPHNPGVFKDVIGYERCSERETVVPVPKRKGRQIIELPWDVTVLTGRLEGRKKDGLSL